MKEYLYTYIKRTDDLLENKKITDDVIKKHLIKIQFFQHERLIHLLVTLFYALFFLVFAYLGFMFYMFFVIALILLIFLLFYVIHYFRLENGVQYLYKQYDKMIEKNTNK